MDNNNSTSKEEDYQINVDNSNLGNENNQKTSEEEKYVFGWGQYSEITNGRFAMIGFAAIILIEMISKKSFLDWAGIIN